MKSFATHYIGQSAVAFFVIVFFVAMALSETSTDETIDPSVDVSGTTQFRRPIALQLDHESETLVVANRKSGSVSLINVHQGEVFGESKIGGRLTGLAHVRRDGVFIATDQETHTIIGLALEKQAKTVVSVLWKVTTSEFPNAMSLNADENRIAVCGLWSRQVTLFENTSWRSAPVRKRTVDLSFCPGHVCWISSSRLVVADAFGDGIAVIDADGRKVFASQIVGHRTGGLALSNDGKWVAFSDQRVNPLARSTKNDVHWGLMVSNQLRWLTVESLSGIEDEAGLASLLNDFQNQPIGRPEDAKADLGPLALSRAGTVALTIGGVNELAVGKRDDDSFGFVPVGRRPMAVTCAENGELGFVANMLDDSVSVVNFEDYSVVKTISLGNSPDLSLVDQGERLFFDARLSHDNWMSCHSCHVEGHTNGSLNDNFSDQSFQTPKRVISLLGHGDTLPLSWSGNHKDFETQIRRSIESTMQSDEPALDGQVEQLAAFVRALPSPPSVSHARGTLDLNSIRRGEALFESLDCVRCHAPPAFTTPDLFDVGIRDEQGETKFNPPSLVGLGQRDRYFHDGRYGDLAAILVVGEHQVARELTDQELSDLTVFLKSL